MDGVLKKYFKTLVDSNRLSHAFLICNTKYCNLKEELDGILSDYFFDGNNSSETLNDLIIITPTNKKIIKEDIINLKEKMMLKSQFNKNRVYIICEAEKMNEYAANSLLKFLEEPEENIYAFLITENVNKVLPTIKSRCQILSIGNKLNFDLSMYDDDLIEKSIAFINLMEDKSEDSIAHIYDYFNKKEERNIIFCFFEIGKFFYNEYLILKLEKKIEIFNNYEKIISKIARNNTEKSILNKIMIILSLENMIEYNVNINLLLDRLIFELGMINHE